MSTTRCGFGINVRSFTMEPRSGIPSAGKTKCLPRYENRSSYHASLMTSIASSNVSRLMRSCSADIALSPDATTVPRLHASRGTVPRPTPISIRPPVMMSASAKSSAKRKGCHCGTTLNICPKRRSFVRPARCMPNKMRFGSTS